MIKKIQKKLDNTLGNEVLAVIEEEKKEEIPIKEPQKKEKLASQIFPIKQKEKPVKSEETEDTKKNTNSLAQSLVRKNTEFKKKKTTTNNHPVLEFLGIEIDINIKDLIQEKDIDEVEFTLTAPTGLDPLEVEKFLDKVRDSISGYKQILKQKEIDFQKLLNEFVELESKYVSSKHDNEMAIFESYLNEE